MEIHNQEILSLSLQISQQPSANNSNINTTFSESLLEELGVSTPTENSVERYSDVESNSQTLQIGDEIAKLDFSAAKDVPGGLLRHLLEGTTAGKNILLKNQLDFVDQRFITSAVVECEVIKLKSAGDQRSELMFGKSGQRKYQKYIQERTQTCITYRFTSKKVVLYKHLD